MVGKHRGISLLELQVAMVLLAIVLAGTAAIFVTELSHLQWNENQRQLYTTMPQGLTQAIFTDLTYGYQTSPAAYVVHVSSFSVWQSSVAAAVVLEAR